MPKTKKKPQEEEVFTPEKEQDFNWAVALASALSGLSGGDFASDLQESIESTRQRNARGREDFEERQLRKAENAAAEERANRQFLATILPDLAGTVAESPAVPTTGGTAPFAPTAGGGIGMELLPTAGTAPDPTAMQGVMDELRAYLGEGLTPELEGLARTGITTRSGAIRGEREREKTERRDEFEFQRQADREDFLVEHGFAEDDLTGFFEWQAEERGLSRDSALADIALTRARIGDIGRQSRDGTVSPQEIQRAKDMAHDMVQSQFGLLVEDLGRSPKSVDEYVRLYRQAINQASLATDSPTARIMIVQDGLRMINNIRQNHPEEED